MATYVIAEKEIRRRKRSPLLWALIGPLVGMAAYGREPESPGMALAFTFLVAFLIGFFHWRKNQPYLDWALGHSFHIGTDHFLIRDMESAVSVPFSSIKRVLIIGEEGRPRSVSLEREEKRVYQLPHYEDFDALLSELETKLDSELFEYR